MDTESSKFFTGKAESKLQELQKENDELKKQRDNYRILKEMLEGNCVLNTEKGKKLFESMFPDFFKKDYGTTLYNKIEENNENITLLKQFLHYLEMQE